MNFTNRTLFVVFVMAVSALTQVEAAELQSHQQLAREIFKELIENRRTSKVSRF